MSYVTRRIVNTPQGCGTVCRRK